MKISVVQPSGDRPLFIDFNLYTDGDADFKKELITHMIDNLQELQKALQTAHQQNTPDLFVKTSHKVKPTLSMLDDKDLLETTHMLSEEFSNSLVRQNGIIRFNTICAGIIKSLEKL